MTTTEQQHRVVPGLTDNEVAEIRALAAARVAGFPPLSREQAALVRDALTSRPRAEPTDAAPEP